MRRAEPMISRLVPEEQPTRRDPVIGYFVETYAGCAGYHEAMWELGGMVNAGVTLTMEIVDHVARKHQREQFRVWVSRQKPRATPQKDEWVYFIVVGERVKIGTSTDPAARAVSLSLRIKDVRAVLSGGRKLEQALHRRFAQYRIDDTEWFTWCDEIDTFVTECAEPFTPDHDAYKPGARKAALDGYAALARRLDSQG